MSLINFDEFDPLAQKPQAAAPVQAHQFQQGGSLMDFGDMNSALPSVDRSASASQNDGERSRGYDDEEQDDRGARRGARRSNKYDDEDEEDGYAGRSEVRRTPVRA